MRLEIYPHLYIDSYVMRLVRLGLALPIFVFLVEYLGVKYDQQVVPPEALIVQLYTAIGALVLSLGVHFRITLYESRRIR